MSNNETKKSVSNMSSRFEARYGHLWVSSNDIEDRENLREKLYQWIEELEYEKIMPETINKITVRVLDMAEFSNFPPNLNRFIFLCKELEKMMTTGSEGKLYLELKRLDEKFTFVYGRLWAESDKDKSKRKIDYWKKELEDEDISPEVIKKTVSNIHKKGCYAQYPPSLNQFVMECLFCRIGDEYTDPDVAFIKASIKDDAQHPTIINTRQMIGSHTLRQSKDKYIRILFEKIYIEECRAYAKSPDKYEKSYFEVEAEEEIQEDDDFSSDTNANFFSTLIKKENAQ